MKKSAGILPFKKSNHTVFFFLAHYGGPLWVNKDTGAWSIIKGGVENEESCLDAAMREWHEETHIQIDGKYIPLKSIRQKSGKIVEAYAIQCDFDPSLLVSNEFEMECPPKSGKINRYPEVDRADWFDLEHAKQKINPAQIDFLLQVLSLVSE